MCALIADDLPHLGPWITLFLNQKADPPDVGIWLGAVHIATVIKDHTIFCLGIDLSFFGRKIERILCSSGCATIQIWMTP